LFAVYESPNISVEAPKFVTDFKKFPGIANGCLNFQPISDYVSQAQKFFDLALIVGAHDFWDKTVEGQPVPCTLTKDGCPAQASLSRFQDEKFEEQSVFMKGHTAQAQYGRRLLSWFAYLHIQQLLPSNRITQVCQDLFGQPVSEAVVFRAIQNTYDRLQPFENTLIHLLRKAQSIGVDESGLRVMDKLHWLHAVVTPLLTFYGVHQKRGNEATDYFDILPQFKNCMVHDFWKPYFKYDCTHGLCNTHLLRELKFLLEENGQTWAAGCFLSLAMSPESE
jgi:hypothetical protein